MLKIMVIIATIVLTLHGLIHLMGGNFVHETGGGARAALQDKRDRGRWDLGATGIGLYGALWAVPAIGFVLAALAFWFGWAGWQAMLLGITLFSLLLTALDWNVAFTGVIINLAILALLGLGPRLAAAFSG